MQIKTSELKYLNCALIFLFKIMYYNNISVYSVVPIWRDLKYFVYV